MDTLQINPLKSGSQPRERTYIRERERERERGGGVGPKQQVHHKTSTPIIIKSIQRAMTK